MKVQQSIQMTLFDYFQDIEKFTLAEATKLVKEERKNLVSDESIRARIYEGIDKGLFERVSKGVYKVVTKDNNTCLMINGNGRDLSMIEDNSIDCIITDHPYELKKSHKGGNRNLAKFNCFQYDENDFKEKARVLKKGSFLVEFLPERNSDNFEYIYQVTQMAQKYGLEFYAVVPWKKGNKIINQGRKSKNTEDIYFFSKGKARNLRKDVKKDLSDPSVQHFMSGTNGMLPTIFDVQPKPDKEKIIPAEKPIELYEQILKYVTLENEIVLDQFAGSGNLGKAALNLNRHSILFEIDDAQYNKMQVSFQGAF